MKSNIWNKLVLWISLGLLLFLNFYTLVHAISGWVLGIVLLLSLFFAHSFFSHRDERFLNRASLFLGILILSIQTAFILILKANIRYDAFWILDQAVEMLETHEISPVISNAYFSQVPNNYGLTILTYWFLSILKALGVPSGCFMRAVQFFNIFFIDLSLLCIYLFIRKRKGVRGAAFFLFFCALSPYLYVWAPYYYTSTTSMLFACLAVFLWECIRTSASWKKQCLLAVLMGILCITGYKVRATSLIAYIAVILYWSVFHQKGSFRRYLRPLLFFILSAAVSFVSWKGIVRHYAPFDTTDTAFPISHFIMLGTYGPDGSFCVDDQRYTISLPTAEAKRAGTMEVIRTRLSENGFAGNVRLLLNKQLNCWADGTDAYMQENNLCSGYNRLHAYITGSRSGYLASYAQIFRWLQLFLVCIYCIWALLSLCPRLRKLFPKILPESARLFEREPGTDLFLLALNLLGGMVFHLLWEAGPLYSIAFTLFSYALAAEGIEMLKSLPILNTQAARTAVFSSSFFCLLISASCLLSNWQIYTQEEQVLTDFVVNQQMETAGEDGPDMETGQIWTQTFETETPFNVLNLYFASPENDENNSVYQITLTDAYGTVFYDEPLYGITEVYAPAYELTFDPVIPKGRTVYTISIEAVSQDMETDNFIRFISQDTSRVDLYPHGELSIDGVPAGRDICFRIVNRHLGTLASKKEYGLFSILLLSLELLLVLKSFRLIHQKRRPVS